MTEPRRQAAADGETEAGIEPAPSPGYQPPRLRCRGRLADVTQITGTGPFLRQPTAETVHLYGVPAPYSDAVLDAHRRSSEP